MLGRNMGNHQMKPLVTAMTALLKERKLPIPEKMLYKFLEEVDRVAPWFSTSGSLTKASWNRLGTDLVREKENGKLKAGVWPLYKMMRACIKDSKLQEQIREGQRALDEHQDSLSEAEKGENAHKPEKEGKSTKAKAFGGEAREKALYPDLERFKTLEIKEDNSGETSSEEGDDASSVSSEGSSLDPEESIELRTVEYIERPKPYAPETVPTAPPLEKGKYGREREERSKPPVLIKERGKRTTSEIEDKSQRSDHCGRGKGSTSLIPAKEIKRIQMAFPVWEDANQVRQHSQLDLKQLKALAEAVQTYGVNASFTQA